jgi:WYL_2, Sm-like SH3 beta-barrel fold
MNNMNNMNKITLEQAEQLIKSTNGNFFTVTFQKKDGTMRTLTGRLGVTKDLKGVGMAYDPKEYDMLPVYEMNNKGYRMINLNTIAALKTDGTEYVIIENEELLND